MCKIVGVGGHHPGSVESVIQDKTKSFQAISCRIGPWAMFRCANTMWGIQSDLDHPHIRPQSDIQTSESKWKCMVEWGHAKIHVKSESFGVDGTTFCQLALGRIVPYICVGLRIFRVREPEVSARNLEGVRYITTCPGCHIGTLLLHPWERFRVWNGWQMLAGTWIMWYPKRERKFGRSLLPVAVRSLEQQGGLWT